MTCPAVLRVTTAGTASRVGERQGGEGRDAASTHTARSAGQRPAGDAGPEAHSPCGEGEQMTEGGVLSSVRRGTTYQVRYASPHPHDMERQPYPCPDEGTLVALLHHCGLEAWSLHRALAELQYAHMAVLLIGLAEAQRQRYFPLYASPRDGPHGHLSGWR